MSAGTHVRQAAPAPGAGKRVRLPLAQASEDEEEEERGSDSCKATRDSCKATREEARTRTRNREGATAARQRGTGATTSRSGVGKVFSHPVRGQQVAPFPHEIAEGVEARDLSRRLPPAQTCLHCKVGRHGTARAGQPPADAAITIAPALGRLCLPAAAPPAGTAARPTAPCRSFPQSSGWGPGVAGSAGCAVRRQDRGACVGPRDQTITSTDARE